MNKKIMLVLLGVFAIVAVGLAMTQDVKSLVAPAKPAVAQAPEVVAPAADTNAPVVALDDCCAAETPLNAKIGETGPRLQKAEVCQMPVDQQCADCQ